MRRAWTAVLLLVLIGAASVLAGEEKQVLPAGALGEIVKRVPAQDAVSAAEISKELIKAGPEGVKQLVGLLVEPGKTDESKIRYALHGLALYVARGGADDERKMLVDTLGAALAEGKLPPLVNAFLIQQLRFCAAKESVPALGRFLLDEKLCEDATQALLSIKGDEAATALREALPQAKGGCRLTIIQALGILRDAKAAPEIAKAVTDENRDIRLAALFALANIGDPASAEVLTKGASVEPPYERSQGTEALLLCAERLVEADKRADAEKIYRQLLATRTAPEDSHTRCAALRGLCSAVGAKAMDDLVAALKSDDNQVRAVAAAVGAAAPGSDITAQWVARLKGADPKLSVEILGILARRGDPAALSAALTAMKDTEKDVRAAAIRAVAAVGKQRAVAPLLAVLGGKEQGDVQVAREALVRIPGEPTTVALVGALPTVPKEVRAVLLGILAGRGAQAQLPAILACTKDEDEGVRVAAIEALGTLGDDQSLPAMLEIVLKGSSDRERQTAERSAESICRRSLKKDEGAAALLAVLPKAEGPARCALLRVLGSTGSAKGLDTLRAALKDPAPEIQDAAVRALAKWPDASVAGDLLGVAKASEKPAHRILALQGYLELLRRPNKRTPEETLKMYQDAMAVAARPEEKKTILSGVSEVKLVSALKMVEPLLDDAAVAAEAEAAVNRLADHLRDVIKDPGDREAMRGALMKVIENSKDGGRRKAAQERLNRYKK